MNNNNGLQIYHYYNMSHDSSDLTPEEHGRAIYFAAIIVMIIIAGLISINMLANYTSNDNGVIIDRIEYNDLTPGETYTIEGQLVTPDGNVIATKTITFVPTTSNGYVEIEFDKCSENGAIVSKFKY